MQHRMILALLLVAGLLAPTVAHADSVYMISGQLEDGTGVFNGTLSYNTFGFGKVTGTITDGSYSFTVPNSYLGETLNEGSYSDVDVFAVGSSFDLSLYIPNALLSGTGGALCSVQSPCSNTSDGTQNVYSAFSENSPGSFSRQRFQTISATPQVTPEPGTFSLLATGVFAVFILFRYRQTAI